METYDELVARFVERIQPAESGCYEWIGSITPAGYGMFYLGKHMLAHRVSYILFVDPDLSDNLIVHHKCGNKRCVNPKHLEKMGKKAHHKMHWKERQRNRRKNSG